MRMFKTLSLSIFALAAQQANTLEAKHDFDVLKYVDPLIGTSNGGEYGGFRIYDFYCYS